MTQDAVDPEVVLQALLAKKGRSHKKANLQRLHELCQAHAAQSNDFSIRTIGGLVERAGFMKGRALYNKASEDYRSLMDAWQLHAGAKLPELPKLLASHEFLRKIDDPAVRSLVQGIVAERDKLRGQVNLLRNSSFVVVDRRPSKADVSPTLEEAGIAQRISLTDSERQALADSIDPAHLEELGFSEGTHGEIVHSSGRTVLAVGFARAVRKVLAASRS